MELPTLVAQLQGAGSCSGVPSTTGAAWAGIYQDASQPANYYYIAEPNLWAGSRTTTIQIGDAVVTLTQRGMTPAGVSNEILNGDFSGDLTGWQPYATPGLNYIVTQVTNGMLEFYRVPPPPGQSNQAVVLQGTGLSPGASEGIEAQFDLGNSSSVRKRISVLMHDGDFSDLSVCTFWLAPNAPLATYAMRTHTTKAWTNATVSFYAATAGSDGGFYQLDNVIVQSAPALAPDHTECVDPTTPGAIGTGDGPELLVNGGFESGTMTGWSLYGQLLSQVSGGVFEFYRPSASPDPAGVILQPTGVPWPPGRS